MYINKLYTGRHFINHCSVQRSKTVAPSSPLSLFP